MKRTVIAALAIVAMVGCSKENSEVEMVDPTTRVAATFNSATITRVSGNDWDTGDQIGISMVEYKTYDPTTTGDYENVPYTVDDTSEGTFTADETAIYFPVDGSQVDFYAYYPHSTVTDNNIVVSVADQKNEHIDLVAAKAAQKTKETSSVNFTGDEAFTHKLSKLTLTIQAGDGITSVEDVTTIIKGQYTTAKFNIYTFEISGEGGLKDDDANLIDIEVTNSSYDEETSVNTSSAILIPTTTAMNGSSIVFTLDSTNYTWDTSALTFKQGYEYGYTVTINKVGLTISGATISGWDDGLDDKDDDDKVIDVYPVVSAD